MTKHRPFPRLRTAAASTVLAAVAASSPPAHAAGTSIASQLAHWSTQAGRPGDAAQGDRFFNARHGGEWSCASCHGTPPTGPGKHAGTGKAIDPLAPVANPKAFTDPARVAQAVEGLHGLGQALGLQGDVDAGHQSPRSDVRLNRR